MLVTVEGERERESCALEPSSRSIRPRKAYGALKVVLDGRAIAHGQHLLDDIQGSAEPGAEHVSFSMTLEDKGQGARDRAPGEFNLSTDTLAVRVLEVIDV